MVRFTGSYIQTSKDNYEEFLKALNIGFILRKAALSSTPVMTISEDGGNWTMITKTSLKSIELHFKLGEEFDEEATDGRKCKTTVTMEGDQLITHQKAVKPGEQDVKVVREFTEDGLIMKMSAGGVTCTQVYKRT